MKIRIKILKPVMLGGRMITAGKIVEIAQAHANDLIARGLAEPNKPEPPSDPEEKK